MKDQIERDFQEWKKEQSSPKTFPWCDSPRQAWLAAAERYSPRWISVGERLPNKDGSYFTDSGLILFENEKWSKEDYDGSGCPKSYPEYPVLWLEGVPPIPKEEA